MSICASVTQREETEPSVHKTTTYMLRLLRKSGRSGSEREHPSMKVIIVKFGGPRFGGRHKFEVLWESRVFMSRKIARKILLSAWLAMDYRLTFSGENCPQAGEEPFVVISNEGREQTIPGTAVKWEWKRNKIPNVFSLYHRGRGTIP